MCLPIGWVLLRDCHVTIGWREAADRADWVLPVVTHPHGPSGHPREGLLQTHHWQSRATCQPENLPSDSWALQESQMWALRAGFHVGSFETVFLLVLSLVPSPPLPSLCLAGYKLYVDMVGGAIGQGACAALRRGNKVYQLDDDMPFIHFLSESEVSQSFHNLWGKSVPVSCVCVHLDLLVYFLYTCALCCWLFRWREKAMTGCSPS